MNYSGINTKFVWSCDIETAANDEAPSFHAKFDGDIKAASNIKDPEKIAANIAEKRAKLSKKDALSWMTGKIVSIGLVNVEDIGKKVKKPRIKAFAGMNEKGLLEAWCKEFDFGNILQLVGKSSENFDYPFIRGRLAVHGIPAPQIMQNSYNLLDVDKMLAYSSQSDQRGTLSKYAFAIGSADKLMDGAMVPKLYAEAIAAKMDGDEKEYARIITSIRDYNISDMVLTAEFAYRLLQ